MKNKPHVISTAVGISNRLQRAGSRIDEHAKRLILQHWQQCPSYLVFGEYENGTLEICCNECDMSFGFVTNNPDNVTRIKKSIGKWERAFEDAIGDFSTHRERIDE